MALNGEALCRTCLAKELNMLSVFDIYMESITLQNVISSVTGIEIVEDDMLPTTICIECRDKAAVAYDFKTRSHEVDEFFHNFLKRDANIPVLKESKDIQVDVKTENYVEGTEDYMDLDFNLPLSNSNDQYDSEEIKSESEPPQPQLKSDHSELNKTNYNLKQTVKKDDCIQKKYKLDGKSNTYCPLCDTTYDDGDSLTKHTWDKHADVMGRKKRGRPKKLETSTILSKLSENDKIKKEVEKYECALCKEDCKTKKELDVHMLCHKDSMFLRCVFCKNTYLNIEYFQRHACTHPTVYAERERDREGLQQNSDCAEVLSVSTQATLQEVFGSNIDTDMMCEVRVCDACGRVVASPEELNKHMDNEHLELTAKCHLCDKVFATVKSAERHRGSCKRVERTLSCSTCGLKFAFEISLNKHILRHHAGQRVSVGFMDRQKAQYSCASCDKTYSSNEQLVRHARIHKTSDKYECDVCKKKFNRRSNLKAHIVRVHESGRPTKGGNSGLCLYCGRSFNNSSNLIVHMRRHTGEKPYQCDFCGKGFPRSSDLQCHRRSHTGEKPCKCEVCGKGFSRSNKLSRHMRVHTGDKPYKCTYCEKAFSQSNDLTLHVRRHTGDKPYACDVCGDRFIQGTALHNHRRAHGHYPPPQPPLTLTVHDIPPTQ